MFTFQKVGHDSRPAIWRTILLVLVSVLAGLVSIVFSPAGYRSGTPAGSDIDAAVIVVSLILDVALATALVWRHRFPFGLTIAAAVGTAALPIGPVPTLIALAALLGRRRGPATWWCTGLVAVTTVIDVIADSRAQPVGASLTASAFQANTSPQTPNTISILTALLVAATFVVIGIGAGLIRRSRREAVMTGRNLSAAHQRAARLDDEVSRRQERDRIAQEVHDSLGHSLSLLSLQAASLETELEGTPHGDSAKALRESAGKAMSELRSLLSLLSEPMSPAPDLPLSKLAEVVEDTFGSGQPITASIYVSEADSADPALSRAVYRTVQELLTNAAKHAPGTTASLKVRASPTDGVRIECSNPVVEGRQSEGSGRGLPGITERAKLLGGTVHWTADNGVFSIRVSIPWRNAS
ncbi:histidine kinase [Cutibacterium equinum]|uniref:histidine kinase n=1 Tax=Cutibacterium equinum TaxID=3016342 RepID=A0ABY7QYU5_9ACTN|nr:sensor histidine kinase [Cutibacterium equinum]WCC80218.1 histidine kinase [Cutibacterium equinum]